MILIFAKKAADPVISSLVLNFLNWKLLETFILKPGNSEIKSEHVKAELAVKREVKSDLEPTRQIAQTWITLQESERAHY